MASDFQYAGIYKHDRSGFHLAMFRAYSAEFGRWLSRDPLSERAGFNLFVYAGGNPIRFKDGTGMQPFEPGFDSGFNTPRLVDKNYTEYAINLTDAPPEAKVISAHSTKSGPLQNAADETISFEEIKKQMTTPLTVLKACESGEPIDEHYPSTAQALASDAKKWVLGYTKDMMSTGEPQFQGTEAVLYNPQGREVRRFNLPMTSLDWQFATGAASKR